MKNESKYTYQIKYSEMDKVRIYQCLELKIFGDGATEKKALAKAKEAVSECLKLQQPDSNGIIHPDDENDK
jgi:phosphoribosylformylglycinamidine (FGAM) synthase PurS component